MHPPDEVTRLGLCRYERFRPVGKPPKIHQTGRFTFPRSADRALVKPVTRWRAWLAITFLAAAIHDKGMFWSPAMVLAWLTLPAIVAWFYREPD